jgi:hypothetical protein
VEQKLGTGALLTMLKKGEVELIVALTEGLVAGFPLTPSHSTPLHSTLPHHYAHLKQDICQGSDVKLLGTYVESPLCWAISAGKNSAINSVEDLRGKVREGEEENRDLTCCPEIWNFQIW